MSNAEKFELANKWIRLQNKGVSIIRNLRNKGVEKIVLYGASEFALRFLEQCDNENNIVEVIGIVDKKITSNGGNYRDIPLLSIDDIVDLDSENTFVVITAMGFYEEILGELHQKGIMNVISLKELIYDVYC